MFSLDCEDAIFCYCASDLAKTCSALHPGQVLAVKEWDKSKVVFSTFAISSTHSERDGADISGRRNNNTCQDHNPLITPDVCM